MSSAISHLLEIQTTACGYVYNREFKTHPTPISHSPGKFWIWQLDFFLKLVFLVVLSKKISEFLVLPSF